MKENLLQAAIGAALALGPVAGSATAFGPLANFDVINDTGQTAHGFEIEIEDLHPNEITSIFGVAPRWTGMNRYGDPAIVEIQKPMAAKGYATRITFQSKYSGGWAVGTPSGTLPVKPSDSCWPLGASGQYGPNYPCDHFGISTSVATGPVKYSWLVESTPGSASLAPVDVAVPTPVWTVVPQPPVVIQPPPPAPNLPPPPPIVQPQPPKVNVVIAAPRPNYYEFGEPRWVKVTATGTLQDIGIENLMAEDRVIKQAKTQVQVEWQLLQTDIGSPGSGQIDLTGVALDPGATGVVYRFEFYAYTGARDPETNQALPKTSDTPQQPDPADLGKFLVAQNAGLNFDGQIPPAPPIPVAPTLNATLAGAVVNSPYSQVIGATPGVPGDPLSFAVTGLPQGLSLVGDTIGGTPTVVGDFPLNITVTDTVNQLSTVGTTSLNVADAPIVFGLSLSQGTVGAAYAETLAAGGGYGGITYLVFNNSLPPGLSLSGNQITGTPTTAGSYNVTLLAKDSLGFIANASQTVTIVAAAVPPPPVACADSHLVITNVGPASVDVGGGVANGGQSILYPAGQGAAQYQVGDLLSFSGTLDGQGYCVADTLSSLPGLNLPALSFLPATAGSAYTTASIAPVGGIAPVTVFVSGLPQGLGFDGAVISGTPTTPGTYTLTITAADAIHEQVVATPQLVVDAAVCSASNAVITNMANRGAWFEVNGGMNGGGQTVTYPAQNATVINPPLTPLTAWTLGNLVSFQGTLDGIGMCHPTTATLSQGLGFAVPVFANAAVGSAYVSVPLAPTGGVPPYSVAVGGLPPSLGVQGSAIVGTPALGQQGTYPLTITVGDATGRVRVVSASLTVDPAPALVLGAASLPATGTVGVAYTGSATAGGGVGTLAWTATGLPTGVNIASDGTLSGTPTAAGTFQPVLTVTDALGQTASLGAAVIIAPAAQLSCTLPKGAKPTQGKKKVTAVGTGYYYAGTVKVVYGDCTRLELNGGAKAIKVGDIAEWEGYVRADGSVFARILTIN
ncbi:Putative Ig domain-containing protein [Methylomagnum ishizawai]|uniref:Ig domain-containing protein n=1 Tax=Methylomagnum ishizawai TaxID=1760988 RepID=A0A1Y6CSD2_9GAMM|nr:putative Ig domain-containing protein [Methylomagnum ishizawai]SMF93341.1 Putative Ig domain-containing protein [Methylomagnum ishizawai]